MQTRCLKVTLFAATLSLLLTACAGAAPPARWLTLETPHFRVHFTAEHQALAEKAARIAEEVHPVLAQDFGYAPAGRTDLVLDDGSDLTNGYASVIYRPTVTILLAPPGTGNYRSGITGSEDWLRFVITHEYAHIIHLDMNDGFSRAAGRLFGRVPLLSAPNGMQSFAFIEGLAVVMETRHTAWGRGDSPMYEMYLRTAALEGKLLRLDQALGEYEWREWVPAGGVYLYGSAFLNYLEGRFGAAKLREFNLRFSRGDRPALGLMVKEVFGQDLPALWQAWQADLAERSWRQAAALSSQGLTASEPLTTEGFSHHAAAFSPDGQTLAYVAEGPAQTGGLWVRRSDGRHQLLVQGAVLENTTLAWSPDGERIAYGKADYVNRTEVRSDLYAYDLKTGRERRLTTGERAFDPAWSPDGRQVAFVSLEDGRSRLEVLDVETGRASVLSEGEGLAEFAAPAWSPDGRQLAVAYKPEHGTWDLALVDAGGGSPVRLWTDPALDRNAAWSPDGRYLFFDSERSGVPNLYAWDVGAGQLYQVTNVVTGAFDPTPSPDGRTLVFLQYGAGGYDLRRMALDAAAWRPVASPGGVAAVAPAREPVRPATPATLPGSTAATVKPYSPWPGLAPAFWFPTLVATRDDRWAPGIMTGGTDPLGRTSYFLEAGVDPSAGWAPVVDLSLSHAVGVAGPVASLRWDEAGREASLTWVRPGVTRSREFSLLASEETGESGAASNWAGGFAASTTWTRGWGAAALTQQAVLAYSHDLGAGETGQATLLTWGGLWSRRDLPVLRLVARGGAADGGKQLSLGNGEAFPVRGVASGTAAGPQGWSATAEVFPLHLFPEVGPRELPLFLNQVEGALFVDAGRVSGGSAAASEASWGGEIRTHTNLFYGILPFEARLGVALPVNGHRDPKVYFRAQFFPALPGPARL